MLKRLDLVGFKSFADKTTFDFGRGITAIVGPNGSGKSNVVDAVRWILGEQSAKSLRGGEMTDVIFNGSASRRSFGMAEVSITFDNSRRLLSYDSEEVQVTRRVYRSGEGEYLINQQPCRLKDIKDLFLGSGAGADAYCIIAQGKVDVLLQASTKERRTIFEEAAGISRFKAKKLETLRKLDRVDQNVQRLRDIVDEVEKQLRSVKLQAAKAQRYQEYSERLKQLRVGLGLLEYHEVSQKLSAEETSLSELRGDLNEQGANVSHWEQEYQQIETRLGELEEQLHQEEATLGNTAQEIKAQQTTWQHERALSADLEDERGRLQRQINELTMHVSTLMHNIRQFQNELEIAEGEAEQQRISVQELEQSYNTLVERIEQIQEEIQGKKADHLEQMRQSARLQNDAVGFKAQVDNLEREMSRLRQKSEQAAVNLASIDVELQELNEADSSLQQRLQQAKDNLAAEKQEATRLRELRDETIEIISKLRQDQTGLAGRAEILEGLERSHEGLGTGVGELLDLLQQSASGNVGEVIWHDFIVGMVADFLTVRREYAPLIDLALGDWSQRFLVRDPRKLAEALAKRGQPFSGRISFLPLIPLRSLENHTSDPPRRNRLIEVSLLGQVRMPKSAQGSPAHPGIIARADELVSVESDELHELPEQLLGRTLIVQDLRIAFTIAAHTSGFRLITLNGEVLEPDGTLTVGTHHAEMGILSRKSELREIRLQFDELQQRIERTESTLMDLREDVALIDSRIQQHQQEIQVLSEQSADLRSRINVHQDRREDLHQEVSLSQDEMQRLEEETERLRYSWKQAQEQASLAEQTVQQLQARIEELEVEQRQSEQQRHARHQEWTGSKIEFAKLEERLGSLQSRHQQQFATMEQRRHERSEAAQNLQWNRERFDDSQYKMLLASSALAMLFSQKERSEFLVRELTQERHTLKSRRQELSGQMQHVRSAWQDRQELFHKHELAANDLRNKCTTLLERIEEDYQINLAQLLEQFHDWEIRNQSTTPEETEPETSEESTAVAEPPPWEIPQDIAAANDEISELRKKLQRLGSVNMDSLQELYDLEIRANTLNTQYEDLTSAKRSLEEIISKINVDSRRLFEETFNTIKSHFQELFRKLFGGGMADIVLEDDTDILESGIEIIARPPGKELRSISLMSGGEKTMTAVALLLSIFRSRPSPFCILDEVDAALDEANIGRFADVLREFLDHSHFIIITHSKRTMAAADVIYGITMQESGISKRVSMRFEDWQDEEIAA